MEWQIGLFLQYRFSFPSSVIPRNHQLLTEDIPSFMIWLSKPFFIGDMSPIFFEPFCISYHILTYTAVKWSLSFPLTLHFAVQGFCSCFPFALGAPCIVHQSKPCQFFRFQLHCHLCHEVFSVPVNYLFILLSLSLSYSHCLCLSFFIAITVFFPSLITFCVLVFPTGQLRSECLTDCWIPSLTQYHIYNG